MYIWTVSFGKVTRYVCFSFVFELNPEHSINKYGPRHIINYLLNLPGLVVTWNIGP